MPKKTIPVKPNELRRGDVIKQTGYRIPVEPDPRAIFRVESTGRYPNPFAPSQNAVEGYLVERVVDEKIVCMQRVREGSRIDDAINLVLGEYRAMEGDMKRLTITTKHDVSGWESKTLVQLEGWTRP